jgi:hypothetical protein
MSSTLQRLLPAIERPEEDQEALAEAAREIEALRTGVYSLSAEEEAAVAEDFVQAERGEFTSDDPIAEVSAASGGGSRRALARKLEATGSNRQPRPARASRGTPPPPL